MLIKTQSLVSDYEFIYRRDPALDDSHPEIDDRYRRFVDHGELDTVPLKPGQKPAVWKLRHLRGRAFARVMDLYRSAVRGSDAESLECVYEAVSYSLAGVDGLRTAEGHKLWSPRFVDDRGLPKLADESLAQLESIDNGLLILAMGEFIVRKLTPDPT